jgi:glycosyltransferase involved in cell wall biosynthesis
VRILVVSSYPPRHCGIGAYAHAQVEALRREGHDVRVISPPDGDGDVRVSFDAGRQFREAERRGRDADRIVVHFEPTVHYRAGAAALPARIRTSLALLRLVRRRPRTEILVHQASPSPRRYRPNQAILRRIFASAPLRFHTDAERRRLERDYGVRVDARLVDHRTGVRSNTDRSREEARRRLDIDPSERLFVCVGFLNPTKGFDRAIRAFEAAGAPGRLVILGSVRDPLPENIAYARDLRSIAAAADGVTLEDRHLPDDAFDDWIVAADRVVLPYRRAWSSGVLARAGVLGTPVLASNVGGLPEQLGPEDRSFSDDDELRALFVELGRGVTTS